MLLLGRCFMLVLPELILRLFGTSMLVISELDLRAVASLMRATSSMLGLGPYFSLSFLLPPYFS